MNTTTLPATAFRVDIGQGCTVCGLCEAIAPAVFAVDGKGSALRPEGKPLWGAFVSDIREAARLCPSGAIRVEE
jgi:ferredoxin